MTRATLDRLGRATFSQAEAARAGLNSRALYRLRDAGEIEQIARGLFRRADAETADLDYIEIALRSPRATICLSSALAHHGLIDAIPARIDIAIPRGTHSPSTVTPATWHHFDAETFDLGRSELDLEDGLTIGLYDPERSIADAFRLRGTEGYETALEALRNWLGKPGSKPADLLAIATKLPRAKSPIRHALEYLT
jgi:predicted transcriptional regulator of viral defense system